MGDENTHIIIPNVGSNTVNRFLQNQIDDEKLGIMAIKKLTTIQGYMLEPVSSFDG